MEFRFFLLRQQIKIESKVYDIYVEHLVAQLDI